MTSEFFPEESQKKLDELANSLGVFIDNANDILGDKANKENFKTALANLSDATKQAKHSLKEFEEFSSAGTEVLRKCDVKVDKVVASMVDASEELSKTAAELRLIFVKMNKGDGTAGRLLNDGRLYEELLDNSQQLEVLIKELRMFFVTVNKKGSLPIKLK